VRNRDAQRRTLMEAMGKFVAKSLKDGVLVDTGALLLKQNDEWQLQRRYMQLEGLQSLSNNQPARLSAVVS